MGYAFAMSPCVVCGKVFTFNPVKVPSIKVNGVWEPACLDCVNRANPLRIENGLEPIVPLPGAYESCPEEELGGYKCRS